jgi:RNA polymerase sigma-70 factor (ECF subfamily)
MAPDTDDPDETDRALLERARDDPAAFGGLFDRHFDAVFGYILRRTRNWDAAKDLTSEVFLKALKNAWRYQQRGVPVSAWFFGIANNELRMYFRRGRRAPASLDSLVAEAGFEIVDPSTLAAERQAAESELERVEAFTRVQAALVHLPVKYQEAIALRFFERRSIVQIGQILGKREGTVKSLISRGVARLRRLLA